MQYLLLIYDTESNRAGRAPEDVKAIMAGYFRFNEHLKEHGHWIGGDALHPVSTATTVRRRDGKVVHTDGPFAETKEQLGGYYLVEADNLDKALELAAMIPTVDSGSIEVRPVLTVEEIQKMA